MFLQEFGKHPNIIRLFNVLKAENDKDIYLVFEHMGEFLNIGIMIHVDKKTCFMAIAKRQYLYLPYFCQN